jgi:hypothetical protein
LKEILCIVVALFISLMVSSQILYALGTGGSTIFPPNSKPYGLSNEQHIKNFWKWIISFPKDRNPWNDSTGANCDNGQSRTNSSVFYISGNGGGISVRTCKVPAGKSLFIPVSPMEISDKEAPKSSVGDLSNIAKKDQDSITSLYLKIDNKEYTRQDLAKYRTHTGAFEVVFPKDAIFGATEGSSKAVADGYYVITEPLAKGPHVIQFKSSLICPGTDCIQPNFAQDIKYNLVAQ